MNLPAEPWYLENHRIKNANGDSLALMFWEEPTLLFLHAPETFRALERLVGLHIEMPSVPTCLRREAAYADAREILKKVRGE